MGSYCSQEDPHDAVKDRLGSPGDNGNDDATGDDGSTTTQENVEAFLVGEVACGLPFDLVSSLVEKAKL